MKIILIILFSAMLFTSNNVKAQTVKKTAKLFVKVFLKSELSQDDFVLQLKPFIDPSANVDSLCLDYYITWKYNKNKNSFPLNTKINEIQMTSPEKALILISNIWHMPDETKYYFVSKTFWNKINGKWFRSGDPAEIIERRKL